MANGDSEQGMRIADSALESMRELAEWSKLDERGYEVFHRNAADYVLRLVKDVRYWQSETRSLVQTCQRHVEATEHTTEQLKSLRLMVATGSISGDQLGIYLDQITEPDTDDDGSSVN